MSNYPGNPSPKTAKSGGYSKSNPSSKAIPGKSQTAGSTTIGNPSALTAKPKAYPQMAGQSKMKQTEGSKQIKEQFLQRGQPSTIGKAPASRVFTRSYEKIADADDAGYGDTVSPFVGNPLAY